MISLIKKHFTFLFIVIGLLISLLGMLIQKSRIEKKSSDLDEAIFTAFQFLFIGLILFALSSWILKVWKEYQLLKKEKMTAELANLKNQVNPHFFFNTLNNLYGLVRKDSEKAEEFILKLSEIMRHSIYVTEEEKVYLKDEIQFLENYIELQKIRYHKNMIIEISHGVEAKEIRIAPLLLIVLLENAFKHGVEKLLEDAHVTSNLYIKHQNLTYVVENNFDPETQSEAGIGLLNLRKRLQILYPNKHQLIIEKNDGLFRTKLEIQLP